MEKALFIDRDGTLVAEPPDKQLDSLEKLQMIPGASEALAKIAGELDFKLVMVTNQDGLGTASFPESEFLPPHNQMLKIFKEAGVVFDEILIDRSLPEENAPTRKPRTGLLEKYLTPATDLAGSFVIGDRLTDMELAKNLKAQGIWFGQSLHKIDPNLLRKEGLVGTIALVTHEWDDIYAYLKSSFPQKRESKQIPGQAGDDRAGSK